jgi:hypothetical protein
VDQPRTVRVTLEFEQGSDPPCGRLLDGQAAYPFAGWLGLAAALEHVIGAGTLTRPGPPAPADELGRRNTTVAPWREQRDPQARLSSDIRRAAGGAPPGVTAHRGMGIRGGLTAITRPSRVLDDGVSAPGRRNPRTHAYGMYEILMPIVTVALL